MLYFNPGHDSQGPTWIPASVVDAVEAARGLLRLPHPEGLEIPQAADDGERLHRRAPHRRRGRRGRQQKQPATKWRPRAAQEGRRAAAEAAAGSRAGAATATAPEMDPSGSGLPHPSRLPPVDSKHLIEVKCAVEEKPAVKDLFEKDGEAEKEEEKKKRKK